MKKIVKIVEYGIGNDGDCSKCTARNSAICLAFNKRIYYGTLEPYDDELNQCQACKDFLAQEASKVYCAGCKHLDVRNFDCMIGEKNENGVWCLNCKSKEQI